MKPFGYRPELDGLRTIAVYVVVAYHSGLSLFSNGYLGVDVFFVLSGFLVTNVLLNELHERGEIRLRRFFARRIRRLLPAGLVTILLTVVALRFATETSERIGVQSDARSAALWFANFNAVDRIRDGLVNPSPLFHFWSLSIEEQYYLVFPAIVLALWTARRRRLDVMWVVLAGAAALGALAQVAFNQADPTAAYYFTHLRIYQMLAGAALAVTLNDRPNLVPNLPGAVPTAALGAVVVLTLGGAEFLSPSLRGVLTTGLIVVVLHGLMHDDSWIKRALSAKPMVYLGGLSYAVYLFHVPIGVITDYAVGAMNPWPKLVYTAVVSTVLAAISASILERPVRVNPILDRYPGGVIAAGLSSSALVGLTIVPLVL